MKRLLAASVLASLAFTQPSVWKAAIPRTWVDAELAALEVPLADVAMSPHQISADYYYKIPTQPLFKSYPVYAPGREPAGYIERLQTLDPEIAFDESRLVTERDWIAAGEIVFDAPVTTGRLGGFGGDAIYLRDPAWYTQTKAAIAARRHAALLPLRDCRERQSSNRHPRVRHVSHAGDARRQRGERCAGKLRVRSGDGLRLPYAQQRSTKRVRSNGFCLRGQPPAALTIAAATKSLEALAAAHEAIPPGVVARHRSSPAYPPQVPDLIGVKDRRYLDRSGCSGTARSSISCATPR